MARPRLLLDEDVRAVLAEILRERGYDAVRVLEVERAGRHDPDQLAYAVGEGRAMLSHNIRDFILLDQLYKRQAQEHYGIIVSTQVSLREMLRRTVRCLSRYTTDRIYNQVVWLQDFK